METPEIKTESDISSNSSWTVLNESNSIEKIESDVAPPPPMEKKMEVQLEAPKPVTKPKRSFIRRVLRIAVRYRNRYWQLIPSILCLLIVAGMSTLSAFASTKIAEAMSEDVTNLQRQIDNQYVNYSLVKRNAVEPATENIWKEGIGDVFLCNRSMDDETCPTQMSNFSVDEDYPGLRINILAPKEAGDMLYDNSEVLEKNKGVVDSLKQFFAKEHTRFVIFAVAQDMLIFQVLRMYLVSRNKKVAESLKEVKTPVKRMLSRKSRDSKFPTKVRKEKKLTTVGTVSEKRVLQKISMINHDGSTSNENGKSECERRFERLETKWANLNENHRKQIDEIQDQYNRSLIDMNNLEKDDYGRAEKISYTREKFIQRLKADREAYLSNLKKLRDERQKLLEDVCRNLKLSRNKLTIESVPVTDVGGSWMKQVK